MGLREAGLQLLSFPYDWNPGPDFVTRCAYLADGIPNWLDRDQLQLMNPEERENLLHYKNLKTGFTFIHDFLAQQRFEEQYPVVKARYDRRISRFQGLLERAQTVLVVWVNVVGDRYQLDAAGAQRGREILQKRWPTKEIDVLLLNFQEGIAYKCAQAEVQTASARCRLTTGIIGRKAGLRTIGFSANGSPRSMLSRITARPRKGKTGGKSPRRRSMAGIMPKTCASTSSPRCNTRSIITS